MLFAGVDWTAVTGVGGLGLGGVGAFLSFRQGRKRDDALQLSTDADRLSKQNETNLTIQQGIIDQLQEEVARYKGDLADMRSELEGKRQEVRDLRHELADARAGLSAATVVIEGLEHQIEGLQHIISRHEETITKLSDQLSAKGPTT